MTTNGETMNLLEHWPWYAAGVGLWMFYAAICYATAPSPVRARFARAFFAAPVWPLGVIALFALMVKNLWNAAGWAR